MVIFLVSSVTRERESQTLEHKQRRQAYSAHTILIMKLRVATYNIHKGVTAFTQRPRIHTLKRALRALGADVIFLQEVQGRHDFLALRLDSHLLNRAQHEFLAGRHYRSAYGMNAKYEHGHHGNALLSYFPILHSENRDVSDHVFESRGILHCIIRIDQINVHCYVVHFGLFARSRRRQADALIETVRATALSQSPVIVAGDFNDWGNRLTEMLQESLSVREVFGDKFDDQGLAAYLRRLTGRRPSSLPARTYPAGQPFLRLDRIYVRGFEVESAEVLYGARWRQLSDHAPIITTLKLV